MRPITFYRPYKSLRVPFINTGHPISTRALLFCLLVLTTSAVYGQSGRTNPRVEDQTAPNPSSDQDDILRITTEELLLPVSVRDESGSPVGGLGKDKFLVFDNGVRQEITSFNRRRVPANIVLLLDASSSVFSQMRFIREAAKRFIQ